MFAYDTKTLLQVDKKLIKFHTSCNILSAFFILFHFICIFSSAPNDFERFIQALGSQRVVAEMTSLLYSSAIWEKMLSSHETTWCLTFTRPPATHKHAHTFTNWLICAHLLINMNVNINQHPETHNIFNLWMDTGRLAFDSFRTCDIQIKKPSFCSGRGRGKCFFLWSGGYVIDNQHR